MPISYMYEDGFEDSGQTPTLSGMYSGGTATPTSSTSGAWTPTTQQGGDYDWSRLLYGGTTDTYREHLFDEDPGAPISTNVTTTLPWGTIDSWGSRAGITMDPFQWTGPERHLVSGSGEGEVYSANPEYDQAAYDAALAEYRANPTFTAKRRTGDRTGWTDDNKYWYETANYGLETGEDGQQYLVQRGDWNPQAEQSSWMMSGPDALRFLGVVGAGALGGQFFGTEALGAGGAMDMGAGGVLEAMGGGAGEILPALTPGATNMLTPEMLTPSAGPITAETLPTLGTIPEASILPELGGSMGGLPGMNNMLDPGMLDPTSGPIPSETLPPGPGPVTPAPLPTTGSLPPIAGVPTGGSGDRSAVDRLIDLFRGTDGKNGLGSSLLGMYSAEKSLERMRDIEDRMLSMYSQDSPYAKTMEQRLDRRDAAAGRRSQYGPRLAELQGNLAESTQKALATMYGATKEDAFFRNNLLNNASGGLDALFENEDFLDLLPDWLKNLGGS